MSPGAHAVLYQTIWRDIHLVRGHGFAHLSFWITKEFRIQLIATCEVAIKLSNIAFQQVLPIVKVAVAHAFGKR